MKKENPVQLLSKKYTVKEEIANGITHGLGVIFGIASLIVLLVISIRKGDNI